MKKLFFLTLVLTAMSSLSLQADSGQFVWSDDFTIDTEDLPTQESPLTVNYSDVLPYSCQWSFGYDRVTSVTATAACVQTPATVVTSTTDGEGVFPCDYFPEAMVPKGVTHTLTHEIKDSQGTVLRTLVCYVVISSSEPEPTIWSSEFSFDSLNIASGQTLLLLPTDNITYSTQWAFGYDRKITLTATPNGNSTSGFSTSDLASSYEFFTSGVEKSGTYAWDYTKIDPQVLPRDVLYTFTYSIYDGETTFATEDAIVNIAILPEPGLIIGFALMALVAIRRSKATRF